ncbi:MAG: LamG-like jellyroll fold domain-containing protein [Nanoarchaeota archaeon]
MVHSRRAVTGIETLIVFIAFILVAATAAGVLMQTIGALRNRALAVGDESRERISDGIEVFKVIGRADEGASMISALDVLIRLQAGSDPQYINDSFLILTFPSDQAEAFYANSLYQSVRGSWKAEHGPWSGESGEFLESSGQGPNGTATGMISSGEGVAGDALDLDGSSGIHLQDSALMTAYKDFTISMWVRGDAAADGTLYGEGIGAQEEYFAIDVDGTTDNLHVVWVDEEGIRNRIQATVDFKDERWHQLTVVRRDASTMELYWDGKWQASNSSAIDPIDVDNVGIGELSTDGLTDRFIGSIDEVNMWDRSLSPREIQNLFSTEHLTWPQAAERYYLNKVKGDSDDILEKGEIFSLHYPITASNWLSESESMDLTLASESTHFFRTTVQMPHTILTEQVTLWP